jgi:hypothetical protein
VEAAPVARQALNVVGPDPGAVDHDLGADMAVRARIGVVQPCARDAITVSGELHDLG